MYKHLDLQRSASGRKHKLRLATRRYKVRPYPAGENVLDTSIVRLQDETPLKRDSRARVSTRASPNSRDTTHVELADARSTWCIRAFTRLDEAPEATWRHDLCNETTARAWCSSDADRVSRMQIVERALRTLDLGIQQLQLTSAAFSQQLQLTCQHFHSLPSYLQECSFCCRHLNWCAQQ